MMRRLSTIIKAATALAGLLALIVGLPWALIAVFGWPLPDHVPNAVDIHQLVTGTWNDTLLVNLVAISGWLVWVWLLRAIVAEMVIACRQPRRDRSHAAERGPVRWLAAGLIGAVIAAVPIAAATAAHAPASPMTMSSADAVSSATTSPSNSDQATPYTVKTGDTLWDIADRALDDPTQWKDIYQDNKGIQQPDGATLSDPDIIKPGWRLHLDTDHSGGTAPPDQPDASPHEQHPTPDTATCAPADTTSHHTDTGPDAHATPTSTGVWLGAGTFMAMTAIAGLLLGVRRARRRALDYTTTTGLAAPAVKLEGELDALETFVDTDLATSLPHTAALATGPDGNEIPIADLAAGGLGLRGEGAHSVARAAIAATLSTGEDPGDSIGRCVVTTRETLDLLGTAEDAAYDHIAHLQVCDSTAEAMAVVMREITTRTRALELPPDAAGNLQPTDQASILVVIDVDDDTGDVEPALAQGRALGIAGIVIGDWAGPTVEVDARGMPHIDLEPEVARFFICDIDTFTDILDTVIDIDHATDDPITGLGTPAPATRRSSGSDAHVDAIRPAEGVDAADTALQPQPIADPPKNRPQPHTRPVVLPGRVPTRPTAILNSDTLAILTGAQQQLVQCLAAHPDGISRDRLVAEILPRASLSQARQQLHALIDDTRRALREATNEPDKQFITFTRHHYHLERDVSVQTLKATST